MPRQRILTPAEQQLFDSPPVFSVLERTKYFVISPALKSLLAGLRTSANQVYFLVQLGYFRATHRFFTPSYPTQDLAYAAGQLQIPPDTVEGAPYDEATSRRHRHLIRAHLGYQPFDTKAQRQVTEHLQPLIHSQVRPKVLFQESLAFLQAHKIETPSCGTLTLLILDAVRHHRHDLVERIRGRLQPEGQRALDALFDKAPDSEHLHVQRARLTLLKRVSHSMKPSKIKENLEDLQTIRDLYQPLHPIVRALDLTPDGLRYYAHSVIKSEVFQVARRADPDRHLHLLCFIAHQYYHLHDLLLETLITAVQNTRNACQRDHQSQYYEEREQRQQAVRSLVDTVEQTVCQALVPIEQIAFEAALSDTEKVRRIQGLLRQRTTERQALQRQITQWKEEWPSDREALAYYDVLERKSVKLQNKVAEIIRQVRFQGTEDPLLEAVRYYQTKEGQLTATAPTAFLPLEERRALTKVDGTFRVSLYKALLFIKVADAVKIGDALCRGFVPLSVAGRLSHSAPRMGTAAFRVLRASATHPCCRGASMAGAAGPHAGPPIHRDQCPYSRGEKRIHQFPQGWPFSLAHP